MPELLGKLVQSLCKKDMLDFTFICSCVQNTKLQTCSSGDWIVIREAIAVNESIFSKFIATFPIESFESMSNECCIFITCKWIQRLPLNVQQEYVSKILKHIFSPIMSCDLTCYAFRCISNVRNT